MDSHPITSGQLEGLFQGNPIASILFGHINRTASYTVKK